VSTLFIQHQNYNRKQDLNSMLQ